MKKHVWIGVCFGVCFGVFFGGMFCSIGLLTKGTWKGVCIGGSNMLLVMNSLPPLNGKTHIIAVVEELMCNQIARLIAFR